MANAGFNQIGNLAFYDKWNPQYVYFKSLLAYANTVSNNTHNGWNPEEAMKVASRAVSEAQTNANLHQMSEDDSITYFLDQFKKISSFLQQAIAAEEASENAYLQEKLKDINKIFTKKEQKQIKELQELKDALVEAKDGTKVPLDKINTLINVIQYGFKSTRALIDYEEKRVESLTKMLDDFIKHRGNQAEGLGIKYRLSEDQRAQMRERAEKKYKQAITDEYVETGHLTRKDGDSYVLWGAATIKEKIPLAMDRLFADWLNTTLAQVTKNKKLVGNIAEILQNTTQFPVNGNFNLLHDDVKEAVIQGIIDFGIKDLSTILSKDISKTMMRRLKRQLLKEDGLLDAAYNFNIAGTESFGIMSTEPDLFKTAHSLAESRKESAKKLYEKMKKLIETEKSNLRHSDESDSYIIKALGHMNSTINQKKKALTNVEDIMDLISELEGLQKELNNARRAWLRSKTPGREVKLSKSSIKAQIQIINGEPRITNLAKVLNNDTRLEAFGFKKGVNPAKLETAITTLKSKASKVLKQEILSSLEQTEFKIEESQLIRYVREELRDLTIHINGPYLLEVLPTISIKQVSKGKAFVEWNNYKGKNDSVEILISTGNVQAKFEETDLYKGALDIFEPIKQKIEQAQQNLLKEYQATIDKHVKQLTDSNDEKKYSKMIEVMDTDETKDKEDNERLSAAKEELRKVTAEYIAAIKRQGREQGGRGGISDEQLVQLGEEYMNTLKNSFYISTTTKSRNEYVNFLGFNGGSLGNSLEQQLNRMNDIFTSAGMPIDDGDIKWLRSAIINCFPGSVVGEKNKTLLESYIGSLAAFALFDEGAVEANIVDNFKTDIVKAIADNKAQKIVHLYLVDGIYVKGSTVLKRTLNTIQNEVIPNIQKIPSVMNRGAGIVIVNKTSAADIKVNRPWKEYVDGGANPDAWTITGKAVEEKVSIKILFLAGLLDIIHSINATLSEVEH